jgi:uncharacterized protein
VRVRATPKSAKDAVEGMEPAAGGHALRVRVRAVPAEGQANRAVIETVAAWLGIAKSSVSLVSGETSRTKTLALAGEPEHIIARLMERSASLKS